MNSAPSATVLFTGLLPFVLLAASALAFPASFFLLRLYRRSVLKGMSASAGVKPDHSIVRGASPVSALSIVRLGELAPTRADGAMLRQTLTGLWNAAAVYAIAGVAYAAVMTAGWLMATKDTAIVATKVALLFWTYYWPAVLAILVVAAHDRRRRLQVLAAYFGPLIALMAVGTARNPDLGVGALPLYWLLTNGPESVLLGTFLLRPIRAVGPLVLTFMLMVSIGSQAIVTVAASDERILRMIAEAGFAVGLGGRGVFFGMILIGISIFAALGWPLLRWIGARYECKRFSARAITLDSMWLLFGIVQSVGLAFEGPPWILTGLVAFGAYKAVTVSAFRFVRGQDIRPRTLLLL